MRTVDYQSILSKADIPGTGNGSRLARNFFDDDRCSKLEHGFGLFAAKNNRKRVKTMTTSKSRQLIALGIVAATLFLSVMWQIVSDRQAVSTRSEVYASYAVWLTLDLVAFWAIFRVGKIRPLRPEQSPKIHVIAFFILGASAFGGVATNAITHLVSLITPETVAVVGSELQKQEARIDQGISLSLLWPVTVAPIAEEVIFRVGILGILISFVRKPWALVLSSVCFAFMHAGVYPSATILAATFMIGMALGVTYLLFGLPAAIALHLLTNSETVWRTWIRSHETIARIYVIIMFSALVYFCFHLVRQRRRIVLDDSDR